MMEHKNFHLTPEYLRNQASEPGQVFDYRDWQIPVGRRFRALKVWSVIRHYGQEGLQYHIRRHVEQARQQILAAAVKATPYSGPAAAS